MKKICLLFMVLTLTGGVGAGQVYRLPAAVAEGLLKSSAVPAGSKSIISSVPASAARQRYLRALGKDNFCDLNVMLEDYFVLNPKAASQQVLQENEGMQKALVKRWLERDFYASQRPRQLRAGVDMQAKQGKIDYLSYIPYDARLVLLGEVHEINWMTENVEAAIMQFKKAHPDKNIYYASEFVDADARQELYVLQKEKEVDQRVLKRPYYRALTKRLLAAGVWVVGLENPALSRELAYTGYTLSFPNTTLAWKTVSPSGMRERNTYWAQIIRRIYAQDPDAVVFVHAGFGHTDYNQPASLAFLLKEFKPFVVEYAAPGVGDINTLLERNMPLAAETLREGIRLQQQDPSQPVFFIRHMHSKRSALVAGCDLHIKKVTAR